MACHASITPPSFRTHQTYPFGRGFGWLICCSWKNSGFPGHSLWLPLVVLKGQTVCDPNTNTPLHMVHSWRMQVKVAKNTITRKVSCAKCVKSKAILVALLCGSSGKSFNPVTARTRLQQFWLSPQVPVEQVFCAFCVSQPKLRPNGHLGNHQQWDGKAEGSMGAVKISAQMRTRKNSEEMIWLAERCPDVITKFSFSFCCSQLICPQKFGQDLTEQNFVGQANKSLPKNQFWVQSLLQWGKNLLPPFA